MRNATLAEIRTRAYQRGDFENSARRFPVTEVNGHVNESIAALYDLLIRARGTSYYEQTSAPVDILAGISQYPLDALFYQLIEIELDTGTSRYPLDLFARYERPHLADSHVGWKGYPYYYILTGNNVEILPTPNAAGMTFTYRYVPPAPRLADDGDSFDGINGWEEWVVVDVARKMATKQRDDVLIGVLTQDLAALTDRVRALGGARDRFGMKRVIDVRGRRWRRWVR